MNKFSMAKDGFEKWWDALKRKQNKEPKIHTSHLFNVRGVISLKSAVTGAKAAN